MYRLYYRAGEYGKMTYDFVDGHTIKEILDYISDNSWQKSMGSINIKRQRFFPERITKFAERKIADENDPKIIDAIENGKKILMEKLKPLIEEEQKRNEEIEKAHLEYLKNKYK